MAETDDLTIEVTINHDTCMGSGNCGFWAPQSFDLDDALGKSVVTDVKGDPIEKILGAARGCPTQSIRVWVDGDRLH